MSVNFFQRPSHSLDFLASVDVAHSTAVEEELEQRDMEIFQQAEDVILYGVSRRLLEHFWLFLQMKLEKKVICLILIIVKENSLLGSIPNGMELSFFHHRQFAYSIAILHIHQCLRTAADCGLALWDKNSI